MKKSFKSKLVFILVALLVTASLTPVPSTKSSAKNLFDGTVYLKGIKVKAHETAKVPNGLMKKAYAEKEVGPYIIMFNGPVENSMKDGVKALGAELNDYLPDFSFLAMMTPETADKVAKLSYVEDVMLYQPAFKINPHLKDNSGNIKDLGESNYRIITFDEKISLDKDITNMGGKKISQSKNNITAKLNKNNLEKISNMNAVKYIEAVPEFVLMNDKAKPLMNVTDMESIGYTGAGQVVGICDTGLDTGKNDSSMHLDFQGRINSIFALGRSTADDTHGHGTHVAGSVLGSGARSNGQFKGSAPSANLVFQSVLDSTGGLGGLPNDLNTLFAQSWNAGARIHTNSWGAAVYGDYTTDSQQVDQYVWNNDMIILFAAGNEGDGTYGTEYNSIGAPGTAKNCITVGASENNRPTMPDTRWGNIGDNPNEIAAFSSRGNCADGRIKPDIVAPGTWILSTKSSVAPVSNYWQGYDNYYAYMGGTSMATPLTAGAVAVAREYMQKQWGITPSPALMKASIINGGTDLGFGYPSKDQGWGRISLTNSLVSKEYKYDDETTSLSTGGNKSYTYAVESSATPLKISLVWTDYAGSTTASKALVNDLDLKITSPSGNVYYGNNFTLPFNSAFDRTNNVENIFINSPEVGNYTVQVLGYNIPQGPQPYALFASANFGTPGPDTTAPTCSITAPTNNQTVKGTVNINASANDNVGVSKVEFYVDGTKLGEDTTAPYSTPWDTTALVNGSSHILTAKAYDAAGNTGDATAINVTVDNTTQVQYTTSNFSGRVTKSKPMTHSINVTAAGTITLTSTGSVTMELLNPSGLSVAKGTSVSYNAAQTGTYKIKVTTTSSKQVSYTVKATYPIVVGLTQLMY